MRVEAIIWLLRVHEPAACDASLEACHVGFSSAVQASLSRVLTTCGLMTVTPEAAGSSPVDPANYSQSTVLPFFR